ncbi:MAG: hypothetical protein AAGF97_10950, partial [Planctomycetota bacterium]
MEFAFISKIKGLFIYFCWQILFDVREKIITSFCGAMHGFRALLYDFAKEVETSWHGGYQNRPQIGGRY